jgi:O-antigen ligase
VEESTGPDLLALAPFVATVLVGGIEYYRRPLSGRAWIVPGLVLTGLLIGVPSGIDDPLPLIYGFAAYVAGVAGFFIGYAEPLKPREPPQLERVMLILLPIVATYGLYQALFPLPVWDAEWLRTVDIVQFGSKQDDNFRAFSTLNAPGTLGVVTAVLAALCLAARRQTAYVSIVGALALACMAVTFVRSAWLALGVAMVLTMLVGRGRYIARVLVLATLVLAMVLVLGPRSTIGAQVVERASTLGELGEDTSAQSRLDTTSAVLPVAIRQPIGAGVGVVGQARNLSDAPDEIDFPDNGYLAILYQTGPVGFALIIGALLWCLVGSLRARVGREWDPLRVSCGVALGTLLFLEIGADVLYGVTGPMVFYFAGLLTRIGEMGRGLGGA